MSIKQLSDYFRKSKPIKSTPATVRQREIVTDIDDNDTPNPDFVRISSTPYHPFKAYRIERNLNCSIFNERLEQAAKDDRHITPDVLNESTGFALSPIVSRNIDFKPEKPESSISYLDDVIETHNDEKHGNETTDDGVSNCYKTADMVDILSEVDTKHADFERIDNEAVNTLGVKTLYKDYTDGDIDSVLDRSDDSVVKFEAQLQIKDETNDKEGVSDDREDLDDNKDKSNNRTCDSDDSLSILKFMNVDFSVVSADVGEASKLNNVSEESLARNSDISINKFSLLRSPATKTSTEFSVSHPTRLTKAYSLPHRSRKQKRNNLNKVNSLSNLDRKNEVRVITQPTGEHLQKWNRSINSRSSENFSSDQNSYTTAIDIESTTSDDHASISSRTTNASDTICDIDEFTLTVTSDATTEFDSKEGFESLLSDRPDTTFNTPRLESAASNISFDIDKCTLTITSESELDSINTTGDNTLNSKHDSTDTVRCENESLQDSFDESSSYMTSPRSPRREMLRRNSFIEAISNTLVDNKEESPVSKETCVVIDSETEGSYYNYGYEIETNSKLTDNEGNVTKQESTDSENVNVVAYF